MFIKSGTATLPHAGFVEAMLGIVTNPMLFTGYLLYGVNMVLLSLALRDNELSLVYPVIALTYVWVSILSFLVLHENMNPFKVAGIVIIVFGVAILGRGGEKA